MHHRARLAGRMHAWAPLFLLLAAGRSGGASFDVVISEIHYNPAGGAPLEHLEYVELQNVGAADVDLSGWSFVEGIRYTFPEGSVLPGRGYLVVSPDPPSARAAYGLSRVEGPYSGRLDNGGEILALVDREGNLVSRLHYLDEDPWPSLPDGLGPSLEFTGVDLEDDLPSRWLPSRRVGGTPGAENTRSAALGERPESFVGGILNEILPSVSGGAGYIELYNPTAEPLAVGGFYLVSAARSLRYRLPGGSTLPPRGFLAIGESSLGFTIPVAPDVYFLLEPDGATLVDAFDVDRAFSERSFGRYPDGGEDAFVLTTPTRGLPNVYAFASPVVLNEIQFHPSFVPPAGDCRRRCSDAQQWIELWNRSGAEVDLGGWSLTKGVSFEFPAGTRVPAGGAIVVAASVDEFRRLYPGVSRVVGDWSGRLSHRSESINLRDALGNRVDHVKYGDGGPRNDVEPEDGVDDGTFRGSPWPTEADGTGRTLERIHPDLDGRSGMAWRASVANGGTPGAQNSVFRSRPGPAIRAVRHEPAVPSSADGVLVTCRVSVVRGTVTAVLDWAVEDGTLKSAPLRDDGTAPDAVAGDGVFSARIPPQPDGSVVRFSITATDADLEWASLPSPPTSKPYPSFTGPFFLYQVDDAPAPENGSPVYRVVMLRRDREHLQNRDVQSDVLLPATFIAGDEVHYTVGLRYRGENSRNLPNRSFRIEFPSEDLFEGIENLNLNAANGGGFGVSSARAIFAYRLFRRAGLPYAQSEPVNLRFPGEVSRTFDSRFERRENFDADFLARYFGGSDGGNLYRGRNPVPGGANANLSYLGEDPDPYRPLYVKRTNKEEDDYSDIIELTRAFDRALTPDGIFAEELERLIDVDEWAKFFAIQAALSNADGGIWNTNGEDYFLYHVPDPPESQRPDAGKFLILPWDLEESFSDPEERLFRPTLPSVRRFLTHPRFAALYHGHLERLVGGPFSRLSMRAFGDFVRRMYDQTDAADFLASVDATVRDRIGYIADNVPRRLTAGALGSASGGTPVIRVGEVWKFFRGLRAPSDPPGAWTSRAFDDSGWEEGPTGIGYGDGDDATVLSDMQDRYTTVFARKAFDLVDPDLVQSLVLSVDYDDAFVAYVNGVEIARSSSAPGSPGGTIAFGDLADGSREAGTPETFQVTPDPGLLVQAGNVLAVVGLNRTADSSDFSLNPALNLVYGSSPFSFTAGCEGTLYSSGSSVEIGGEVDPALARSVTVNGVLATLSFVTTGTGPYPARWQATVPVEPGENRLLVQVFQLPDGEGPPLASREVTVRRVSGPLNAVGGTLSGDVEWSPEGGPYYVTRDVVVPAGSRLAILPGTTVLAAGGTAIRVEGALEAAGTEAAPIRFDAFRCGEPWRGIRLVRTGAGSGAPVHMLRRCVFAAGSDGGSGNGLVAVEASRALVEDCAFLNAASAGLTASDARVEVRRSSFEGLRGGIRTTASAAVISGCAFEAPVGNRRSIDLSGDGAERCLVEDTRVAGGLLDGMRFRNTSVDLERVWVEDLVDAGLRFAGSGALGQSSLSDSVVVGCGVGALVEAGAVLEGDHDTVVACGVGLEFAAPAGGGEGGHGRLHSLILAQNGLDVLADGASSLALEHSDLAGGTLWPGDGNIALPPLFVAPTRRDFSLRPGSPCIGTGKDGSDMGAIPYAGDPAFVRADSNFDGTVDLSDAVSTLRFLFGGSDPPACLDALDADDTGKVEITDPIFTLTFLFLSGTPIPPPYPDAGPDPTPDALGCAM